MVTTKVYTRPCKLSIDYVKKVFLLKPSQIIDYLNLKTPIYQKTAAYGHFGREDVKFSWEETNKVEQLKDALNGDLLD